MSFSFSKYHGTGNDFLLIDDREKVFLVDSKKISNLCHRQYGVGADGLILLNPSEKGDFSMRVFNADGSEAEMCGNGLRCLVQFIIDLGVEKSEFLIETEKKIYRCSKRNQAISVRMGIPKIIEKSSSKLLLDVGVPHLVIFVEDLKRFDEEAKGHFSHLGVNINYAKIDPFGAIHMRTFERGVEKETFSCGTGATAVCMAAWKQLGISGSVEVIFASKERLQFELVTKDQNIKEIVMSGKVRHIFNGEMQQ